MDNAEFDKIRIGSRDEIVVRRYLGRERQRVEWVNFDRRLINGYSAEEIVEYVKNEPQHTTILTETE
ncbi:MAG: hypothetical protein IKV77_05170 [Alistipes sp.]|nr:hypothetical protein [Bacteroidales bacterium]MBR5492502.1 hypothetical protein [Alistipes sp.]MBR5920047.1 hypothetical protein [Bacteroidales bacterium]